METITKNAVETQRFGEEIGSSLKGGEILALRGELGSGKTTFIQGLAKGLGVKSRIISPTFIIMRSYRVTNPMSAVTTMYHLDLYRLEKNADQELKNLGIQEFWTKPENVVVIEWAERAKDVLPKGTKWIKFDNIDEETRKIVAEI